MTEFIAIPAIAAVCYVLAELYKALAREDMHRHVPVLCAVCGVVLGIACHLLIPGYIPAENALVAAAIGAASGWAATGVHQTYRQESGE